MGNGASALAAQKIREALNARGESLVWLADQAGKARETTRRKVGQGEGELTMSEITAYCRALDLDPGVLAYDALRQVAA